MSGNANTTLTIVFGGKTAKVKVLATALAHLQNWYEAQEVFTSGEGPYEAVLDVSPAFAANLAALISADDVLSEVKTLLRLLHNFEERAADGLAPKTILAIALMADVFGLAQSWVDWVHGCASSHVDLLAAKAEGATPVEASEYEVLLLASATAKWQATFFRVAAVLVANSTVETTEAGTRRLKPTGEDTGVVLGHICGDAVAGGLLEVREAVLRAVLAEADEGAASYEAKRARGDEGLCCLACIGARCGALTGCLADLGLWPSKKPEEVDGAALKGLQARMEGMAEGKELSGRVAPHAGVCEEHTGGVGGTNLFSIEDVAYSMWADIAERIKDEIFESRMNSLLFG
jgi:hypothetical protein